MNPKVLILITAMAVGGILGIYIVVEEAKSTDLVDPDAGHDHEPTVQVANRGEPKVSLKPGFEQIGRLQAKVPQNWKRENPSSSMRIAQFVLPGNDGDGEMVIFSGIGGSVDANLERWYGQFQSEAGTSVSEFAQKKHIHNNDLEITISCAEGTYFKSSMGMGEPTTEMPNYAVMAAIVIAKDAPYFFKGIGPKSPMELNQKKFESFIRSIEAL